MYALLKALPPRELFLQQLPSFGIALIIAELFFKFHSFTLECVAFLATWFIADVLIGFARKQVRTLSKSDSGPMD